jgi:hypothetical protein
VLVAPEEQEGTLEPLDKANIHAMTKPEHPSTGVPALGEGHQTASWIWTSPGASTVDNPQMHDGMLSYLSLQRDKNK